MSGCLLNLGSGRAPLSGRLVCSFRRYQRCSGSSVESIFGSVSLHFLPEFIARISFPVTLLLPFLLGLFQMWFAKRLYFGLWMLIGPRPSEKQSFSDGWSKWSRNLAWGGKKMGGGVYLRSHGLQELMSSVPGQRLWRLPINTSVWGSWAAYWRSVDVFFDRYLRDVARVWQDGSSGSPLVATQVVLSTHW